MAEFKKYLGMEALEQLVAEVKKADEATLTAAKDYADDINDDLSGRLDLVEADAATHATKTDVENTFKNYRTSADQDVIDNGHADRITALEGRYTDDAVNDLVEGAKSYADGLVNDAVSTIEADVAGQFAALDYENTIANVYGSISAVEGSVSDLTNIVGLKAEQSDLDDLSATVGSLGTDLGTLSGDLESYRLEVENNFGGVNTTIENLGQELNSSIDEINGNLTTKVDQSSYDEAIAQLELSISERVTQTDYDIKVEELEGAIADRVETGTYNEKMVEIENAISTKVETSDYEAKVAELEGNITANAEAITAITEGIDPDKIDSLKDLVEWADEHTSEVASIKKDIAACATKEELNTAKNDLTSYVDEKTSGIASESLVTELGNRITALENVKDNYKAADTALEGRVDTKLADKADKTQVATDIATAKSGAIAEATRLDGVLKTELQAEIDADVKVVADDLAGYKTTNAAALDLKADKTQVATDIADAEDRVDTKLADYTKTADLDTALGLTNKLAAKADKSVVDAMYTNDAIDSAIATAKSGAESVAAADATSKANKALDDAKAYVDGKDFAGIKSTDIANWNAEIGAKELAGTKITMAEVEAKGYALDADLDKVDGRLAAAEKAIADHNAELATHIAISAAEVTALFAAKAE